MLDVRPLQNARGKPGVEKLIDQLYPDGESI
jgi:hypothetical protein